MLNNLNNLSLKCVRLDVGFMKWLQLRCPVLQTIVLDDVKGLYEEIDIFSPRVKQLKLLNIGCDDNMEDDFDDFDYLRVYGVLKIKAPLLEGIEIGGKFLGVQCHLENMSSLKNVKFTFCYSTFDPSSLWSGVRGVCLKAEQRYLMDRPYAIWVNMDTRVLTPIYHVEEITIGTELIQALSLVERVRRPSSTTFMCKRLTLHSLISIYELPGILRLLRSTPLLETLVIKMSPCQSHFSSYCESYFHVNDILYWASQKENIVCLKKVWIDYGGLRRITTTKTHALIMNL